jgi:hypothetical protein
LRGGGVGAAPHRRDAVGPGVFVRTGALP